MKSSPSFRPDRGTYHPNRPWPAWVGVVIAGLGLAVLWWWTPQAAAADLQVPRVAAENLQVSAQAGDDEFPPLPILSSQALGGKDNTWSVATGDVNGDGYLDIVAGGGAATWIGSNRIYLNDGSGHFGSPELVRDFSAPSTGKSVVLADMNGDGTLDIVASVYGQQNELYLNDGAGDFGSPQFFGEASAQTVRIAVGDLDGDGFFDVVSGATCPEESRSDCIPNHIFFNDGKGNLATKPARPLGPTGSQGTADVALADVDNDGRLDIIVGSSDGLIEVYLNDGQGNWDRPENRRELGSSALTQALVTGDMNNDGYIDLVQVNFEKNVVYLNDLTGSFVVAQQIDYGLSVTLVAATAADLNGDGYLDLVAGAGGTENPEKNLVLLNDGSGSFGTPMSFGSPNTTSSVAVADFNKDGVLDLVVGNFQDAEVWVYLREAQGLFATAQEIGSASASQDILLGNLDGDQYLDVLLVGGRNQLHSIYLNDGQCLFDSSCTQYTFGSGQGSRTLVLADLNGDDRLDIVEGNDGRNYVYLAKKSNTFGGLETGIPFGSEDKKTESIAVADVDGNGHLDIIVGNIGQNYVYLNDANGQGRFDRPGAARPFGPGIDITTAVAAGDLDQDGHIDIVVGNGSGVRNGRYVPAEENRIYFNDGRGFFPREMVFGKPDSTTDIALSDLNGDRLVDIAVVNSYSDRNQVYLNEGAGGFSSSDPFGSFRFSQGLVTGDLDGDGDFDLVVADTTGLEVYLNPGSGIFDQSLRLDKTRLYGTTGVALGDLNGDGMLDLASSRGTTYALPSRLYLNRVHTTGRLANNPPYLTVGYPATTRQASLAFSPKVVTDRYIPIPFRLYDQEGDTVGGVAAFYSLDGGGKWFPAIAKEGTSSSHLAASPDGQEYEFIWDTLVTGVFGRSDNVVVRLEAYSQPQSAAKAEAYLYSNRVPGPAQWPFATATTAPFRLQGTQVKVSNQDGKPIEGAYVFRLQGGHFSGAELMPEPAKALRTDAQGFLPGRGELAEQDQVMAVLPITPTVPITFTNHYRFFYTSAAPKEDGLAMQEVSETGIIELTIPTDTKKVVNPLLLYDLTVSTEWDASGDELFLAELDEGFQRASELLYDVTNGQMALGQVYVLPAKTFWNRADIVLYATNSLRPSAAIGGVTNRPKAEQVRPAPNQAPTETVAKAYVRGQIRLGTVWDPFGENTSDLGEQWWRALAHELGHYLLFLPDNYIGVKPDETGKQYLGRIDCQGSFMTTSRDPSYSEFLTAEEWQAVKIDQNQRQVANDCERSLAEITTGRADWDTITHFYPMLNAPTDSFEGPTNLPLDVTHLVRWKLPNERKALPTRNFDIRDEAGKRIRLPNAQVYLLQTNVKEDPSDDTLIALGAPTAGGDRIKVRGAVPGDRLCLVNFSDPEKTYVGCVPSLTNANVFIPVKALEATPTNPRWAPSITVQAETTRTLTIRVTQALIGDAKLRVQVFPASYPSYPGLAPLAVMESSDSVHHQATINLPLPASDVAIRVWVADNSYREAVTQHFLRLPWTANDRPVSGPQIPFFGRGDFAAVGTGDFAAVGTGDFAAVGAGDYAAIGTGDYATIGAGDFAAVGSGDYAVLGSGDYAAVGTGDFAAVGAGDFAAVGTGDFAAVGAGDFAAVGTGDYAAVGSGDYAVVGAGDYAAVGSASTLSTDAQVVIYGQRGLFEPSGIRSLQVLPTPPELDSQPWLVPVGQAYSVEPDDQVIAARTIAFNYLQRDVPEGYEHTLAIYYLPEGSKTWTPLESRQFPENLVVADLQPGAGTYAVMSTVALPEMHPGWNLFAYPLPDARSIITALASIRDNYSVVYQPDATEASLLALLASSPGVSSGQQVEPRTNLYVRSGPGISYKAIGFVRKGELVPYLETDPDSGWYRIVCPAGLTQQPECWVSGNAKYAKVTAGAAVPNGIEEALADVQTNVRELQFNRIYWIKIEGDESVTLYLAPPRRSPEGVVPGSR